MISNPPISVVFTNSASVLIVRYLCDPLPVYVVVAIDAVHLAMQHMSPRVEDTVEICIDHCGLRLSGHGRAIPALHCQLALRRHVARKCNAHCLELRETILDGQCRRFAELLAACCAGFGNLPSGASGSKLGSGTGGSVGNAPIRPVECCCRVGG